MSTLSTFARYADFGRTRKNNDGKLEGKGTIVDSYKGGGAGQPNAYIADKLNADKRRANVYQPGETDLKRPTIYKEGATNVPRPQYKPGEADIRKPSGLVNLPYKSKQRMKGSKLEKLRGIKKRNIIIGSSLAAAGVLGTGLGVAGMLKKKDNRTEMSGHYNLASFVSDEKKKAVKALTQTGNPVTDAAIKAARDASRKARQKEIGNLKTQRGFEKLADSGDTYKGAKAGEYLGRTSALLTSPERSLIQAGKSSQNGFVKGLAEGAEKFGRAGYKTGATGLRGVGNAIVGRTVTGKAARAVGVVGTLGTIGALMKKKNNNEG